LYETKTDIRVIPIGDGYQIGKICEFN